MVPPAISFSSYRVWRMMAISLLTTSESSAISLALGWRRQSTLRASSSRSWLSSQRGDSGRKTMLPRVTRAKAIWKAMGKLSAISIV